MQQKSYIYIYIDVCDVCIHICVYTYHIYIYADYNIHDASFMSRKTSLTENIKEVRTPPLKRNQPGLMGLFFYQEPIILVETYHCVIHSALSTPRKKEKE